MNPSYKAFVRGLFKSMPSPEASMMHSAIGIAGEGGEVLDTAKKMWVYNQTLDTVKDGKTHRENLIEELGDLFFYATALMDQINTELPEVLAANVLKLQKRYPAGYSDAHAEARLDKAPE